MFTYLLNLPIKGGQMFFKWAVEKFILTFFMCNKALVCACAEHFRVFIYLKVLVIFPLCMCCLPVRTPTIVVTNRKLSHAGI